MSDQTARLVERTADGDQAEVVLFGTVVARLGRLNGNRQGRGETERGRGCADPDPRGPAPGQSATSISTVG